MLLLLLALGASPQAGRSPFEALVDRVSARYERLRDFEANFTQSLYRPAVRKRLEERGKVYIKKPGRMRWEYEAPEAKLFVSDGRKTYFYIPEDHEVIVSHHPSGVLSMADDSPLAILAADRKLRDVFTIEASASPPAVGGAVLRLLPKNPSAEFEEIEIEVNPVGGDVLRVVLMDVQHNTTDFRFEKTRENQRLSDSLFRFVAPKGAEIVLADDALPGKK